MSDYKSTVQLSISRLESDEIVEKLRGGHLTDEAKSVAEEILKERGISSETVLSQELITKNSDIFKSEDVAYVGYPTMFILIWMVTAFLLGITSSFTNTGSSPPSLNVAFERLLGGISWMVIAAFAVSIYAFFKRKKITTNEDVLRKYRSNIKAIVFLNLIICGLLLVRFFSEYTSFLTLVDLFFATSLTFAIFKRVRSAKVVLAYYAFVSTLVYCFAGSGGTVGVLWSLVFLSCCQANVAEKKFLS